MRTLTELLGGIVAPDSLKEIQASLDQFMDVPLKNLGVDSLATFEVLERIENLNGHELDYDALNLDDLTTLRGISTLLEQRGLEE